MNKLIAVFFLFVSVFSFAQTQKPVLAILPFEYQGGVSGDETKTIELLVQSSISGFNDFRLVAMADRDRILTEQEFAAAAQTSSTGALGEILSANFLLSGNIGAVADNRIITLDVVNVKTGEKKSLSSVHRSMTELLQETPGLVARLFERTETVSAAIAATTNQVLPIETDIIGNWRGDKGIDSIEVLRGGKAYAQFSSKVQMELKYTIVGQEIRFVQSSPNNLLFYHPVPYKVALQLVSLARPMEWRFELLAKGTVLSGIKASTAARYELDRLIEVAHGTTREAEWTRLSQ